MAMNNILRLYLQVAHSAAAFPRAAGAWLSDWRSHVREPKFWLTFAAYAIPLAVLLYVLYINFLPFGYNKTFVINVGAQDDTSGEFRLDPSRYLSDRKTANDGTIYR